MERWSVSSFCTNVELVAHSSTSSPPKSQVLSPPAVALRSRARAPLRTAVAPAADSTVPGSMIEGFFASRRSLRRFSQEVSPAVAVSARAPAIARRIEMIVIVKCRRKGLPTKVETELEQRRRGECLELLRHVATPRDREIALRIAAPVVRPRLQVARREHDAGGARPRLPNQRIR